MLLMRVCNEEKAISGECGWCNVSFWRRNKRKSSTCSCTEDDECKRSLPQAPQPSLAFICLHVIWPPLKAPIKSPPFYSRCRQLPMLPLSELLSSLPPQVLASLISQTPSRRDGRRQPRGRDLRSITRPAEVHAAIAASCFRYLVHKKKKERQKEVGRMGRKLGDWWACTDGRQWLYCLTGHAENQLHGFLHCSPDTLHLSLRHTHAHLHWANDVICRQVKVSVWQLGTPGQTFSTLPINR